ncbi:MAG: PDZ domain-containing protein [Longimicrobiales bacterium]|nr:PDZ domain-containing protein [Longimicrobiales bacterium]
MTIERIPVGVVALFCVTVATTLSGGASHLHALAQQDVLMGRVDLRATPSGWVGIGLHEVTVGDTTWVRVRSVHPEGPAHRSGLRSGDRVVRVNGAPITPAIMESLGPRIRPGDPFTFDVIRAGKELEFSLVAEDRPPEGDLVMERLQMQLDTLRIRMLKSLDTLRIPTDAAIPSLQVRRLSDGGDGGRFTFVITASLGREVTVVPARVDSPLRRVEGSTPAERRAEGRTIQEWRVTSPLAPWTEGIDRIAGAELHRVNPELGHYLDVSGGLLVVDVVTGTPASRAGLHPGDVVVAVNGRAVNSLEAVRRLLSLSDVTHTLQIVRHGTPRDIPLHR